MLQRNQKPFVHFWPQRSSSEGYWSPLQLFSFCSEVFRIFGNYFEVFWFFWNYFEVFLDFIGIILNFFEFFGSILKFLECLSGGKNVLKSSPLDEYPYPHRRFVARPATVHRTRLNFRPRSRTGTFPPAQNAARPNGTPPNILPSAHHIGPPSTSHSISTQQTPVASLCKGSSQARHPRFLSLLFSFSLFSLLLVATPALVEPTKREPNHQRCLFLNK